MTHESVLFTIRYCAWLGWTAGATAMVRAAAGSAAAAGTELDRDRCRATASRTRARSSWSFNYSRWGTSSPPPPPYALARGDPEAPLRSRGARRFACALARDTDFINNTNNRCVE